MGLSRAFGCFKNPGSRALKKQKEAGKRIRNEKAQPNRVIATAGRDGQDETEVRNLPDRSLLPDTATMRNYKPSPLATGNDEPEPWTVGAVIRRTSLLQARLAEAANERKQIQEVGIQNSEAKYQAMVEEDTQVPTIETRSEVIAGDKENKETSTRETTSTLNMTSIRNEGGEGSGVRATMIFGLPTTKKEPEVDLKAIEEEAENRTRMEENNALSAKGSHNGKYGGAKNWSQSYSQRPNPISLDDRNTRKSGWGLTGLSGSFGPAIDEPYYDYATGASSGSASSPYSSPYGYSRKGNPYYAYVSGPAN